MAQKKNNKQNLPCLASGMFNSCLSRGSFIQRTCYLKRISETFVRGFSVLCYKAGVEINLL